MKSAVWACEYERNGQPIGYSGWENERVLLNIVVASLYTHASMNGLINFGGVVIIVQSINPPPPPPSLEH